jgi:hypothetical protein
MRLILALPLLIAAAGCDVNRDAANDQTTIGFNEQRIENAAEDVTNVAADAAQDVGNATVDAGRAIGNELDSLDDGDDNANRSGNSH